MFVNGIVTNPFYFIINCIINPSNVEITIAFFSLNDVHS